MSRSLTVQQIEMNWDDFMVKLKFHFKEDRKEKLLAFYDKHANRLATMPASGNVNYHNAFVGGYIEHILRVTKLSFQIKELWKFNNATIDFTDEELAMVALNHDLGKFGLEEHEYYIDQNDDWKKKKGEKFKHNPDMQFMKTSDRTLFLLQQMGITLTQKEWLGITLHDGLYEESNKSYYVAYNDDYRLKTNLPYIVHQADLAATRIEYDMYHAIDKTRDPTERPIGGVKPKFEKLPEVEDSLVMPSEPHIIKENSSKSIGKNKYSHLLK